MTWSSFMRSASSCEHGVHVYEDAAELVESVRGYLEAGFAAGQPGLVIATAANRAAIEAELDAPAGLLSSLDAEEMLAALMVDGMPSAERFEAALGGLVDELALRFPGATVRAFGEMVDILWRRGERDAALALEELWNELARTRAFALLCGYCLDIFDVDVQRHALPKIFAAHTHARAGDPARLASAVDQAAAEALGPMELANAYLAVAERVPLGPLPRAAALLAFFAEQSSGRAVDVLQRARALYSV
jgi:MEDS: MEthanogen/methylotroph, DcmR Sensory domain